MERAKIIRSIAALLLIAILGGGGYWRSLHIQHPAYYGETMGTGYSIKLSGWIKRSDLKTLKQQIDSALEEVNRQMSTWDPESEISRFNHSSTTEPMPVSKDFSEVVSRAIAFSRDTGGAFDPTLQPLLNLWGFGSESKGRRIPGDQEISAAKSRTGWEKVSVTPDGLAKQDAALSLALGAIAKGYGVDKVGEVLERNGFENWFVEIGGEVLVKGMNPQKEPWRLGIQFPSTNPMDGSLQGIAHLTSGAIATSGDYRNYIQEDGIIYSHILDPRSGKAVRSDTASVSVFARNCTDADAIATALYVMGPEDGLRWIEQLDGAEALFLIRDAENKISERFSSGFFNVTGYVPEH